ncbi:MAG: DUF4239 domain-containing protein [Chlorobium limicola]|uniref:DUF4239 domain-containing protein n=1 Tax=Chlorobium limicola (strain DSM 245 / NBRC 103803 / 6330) TaxID=290315 RepID=B3ECR7_CHLL2|nr:DUF4239 domain-containing protein [Chlorobium limicola]ACD90342.1 conserved hypothetical protein [Chlorobium limicola DSM 245]NTV07592.1 DUF4239 domain-containing protein [Chlorobium limicola]NTV21497.1 DUF4239 domain-containing protein [Chlorobium limicola]
MEHIVMVSVITLLVMAASVLVMLLVRKNIGYTELAKHNDVAGFIFAVIGVVYAVLLAFVVIVAWQMFRETEEKVHTEVRCMASVFRDIRLIDDPNRMEIQKEIINYTNIVIHEEWPLLGQGKSNRKALDSMHRIFNLVAAVTPDDAYEEIWYGEIVMKMNLFSDARNERILAAKDAIPGLLWNVLLLGALICIGISCLFGTSHTWAHIVMVASLSAIITLVLMTIIAFNQPYKGSISVKPDAFIEQLSHFENYMQTKNARPAGMSR